MNWIQSLSRAIQYMEDHLTEDISIDDISCQAFTSSRYIINTYR